MNFTLEIQKNEMFSVGLEILKSLEDIGFKAFFVGGCVRDLVIGGGDPHDIDITTNAPMEVIESLFDCHNIGQSKDFGIVVVNLGKFSFEVAQFRVDSKESDGRRPDKVEITNSFEEDVKRRDFTINALGMDKFGRVIDFVDGLNDIRNGIVRSVGDPVERFEEDHLRMLRAVRFASRFGFKIDDFTFAAIRMLRGKIDLIAKERVKDELFKMASVNGKKFVESIQLLDHVRLLEIILPEVKALQDVQEEPRFHPEAYSQGDGTSFVHTMEAVKQNVKKDALINMAVLFHDLGKSITHELAKRKYPEYRHRFHNHDAKGAVLAEQIADRLKFTTYEKEVVVFCAKSHMSIFHCKKMKKSTAAKYATNELFPYLKEVMFCDDSCRVGSFNSEKFKDTIKTIEKIGRDYKQFNKDNKNVKIVDGRVVMELTGLKPGPKVGDIIKKVTERFLDAENFVCLRGLIKEVANELK